MAKAQSNPQSESYTKRADSKKSAKPVGARFTNKLAKRLGKKNPKTKPTLAEIEKYLGKGVYKEKRKDKSDINPKQKLAKGGKLSSEELMKLYNTKKTFSEKDNDAIDNAIDEGILDTDDIKQDFIAYVEAKLKKSGVEFEDEDIYDFTDEDYQNGLTHHENYENFSESKKFAKGGSTKQTAPQSDVYNEFRDLTKKAKPVGWRYTNKGAKALKVKNPFARPSKAHIDKYGNSERGYLDYETRADKTDEKPNERFAKGGQTPPQGENYSRKRDKEKSATRVGWRYSQGLAKRLGIKNPQTKTPTQEHIDKYQDAKKNSVYWEGRADKSDINPKSKFESGGENEYAKGGQAPSYKETYFGNVWSKKNDKEEKAKPVGYRYTEKLAKRLGKSPYAKVTPEHKEKYLGRGVYFENRKDKSDINPNQKLASGGKVNQTAPQSDVYNEFRDLTKSAKPVGWRYTNKGAKALKADPFARPSKAHIDKYGNSERGYLDYETRADKSDEKPKSKFEGGGENEMAKGGQARISNSEASSYAENHQPFKGNNLEAKNLENGDYVVLSYGYYPIWYWNKKENKWYQNKDKFSQTTARHITASRPTYDAEVVARDEMDKMMAKSLEGHGFMAMGGDVKE